MGIVYSFFYHLHELKEFAFQKQINRRKILWRKKFEHLYAEIDRHVLSAITAAGFEDLVKGDRAKPIDMPMDRIVKGLQLWFEREAADGAKSIYVHVARYPYLEFQIMFSRSRGSKVVDSACLAKSSDQAYGLWGKPRLRPIRFWSDEQSSQIVTTVSSILPQVFRFLQLGEIGPNIGIGSD